MSCRVRLRPFPINAINAINPISAVNPISANNSATDNPDGRAPLSFLDRPPPSWAEVEIVTIPSNERRPYDEVGWRRAMVVVERGEIGFECIRGGRRTFGAGSVLWTVGLDLVSLYNAGDVPVVLSVVQRRRVSLPATHTGASALRCHGLARRQRKRRRRRLLLTTNTLEKAIASPASIGLSSPAAARGKAATL